MDIKDLPTKGHVAPKSTRSVKFNSKKHEVVFYKRFYKIQLY